jgi:putative transposase
MPHWLVADHTYFVTIRLAGTIPRALLNALKVERKTLADAAESEDARQDLLRKQFVRIEKVLDAHNPDRHWLTQPPVATAFFDALPWLEDSARGWDIYATTLMGTHAHMVLRNLAGRSGELLADLAQFKRHTAREGNKVLGRSGAFWARENFDHWCRTENKVIGAVRYTANNPVAAGQCSSWRDWQWTRVKPEWVELAGL